jgi:hypothetical protein
MRNYHFLFNTNGGGWYPRLLGHVPATKQFPLRLLLPFSFNNHHYHKLRLSIIPAVTVLSGSCNMCGCFSGEFSTSGGYVGYGKSSLSYGPHNQPNPAALPNPLLSNGTEIFYDDQ